MGWMGGMPLHFFPFLFFLLMKYLQCYMAPHNEEDDPAIYRSGSQKKTKSSANSVASSSKKHGSASTNGAANSDTVDVDEEEEIEPAPDSDPMDEDEDEEEDSTLLAVQPGFNRLLLVLRDERVMRFVKYVSAAAEGSRWDVCGEYEVGVVQEAEDEDSGSADGR